MVVIFSVPVRRERPTMFVLYLPEIKARQALRALSESPPNF
jgi:hypothetical protein